MWQKWSRMPVLMAFGVLVLAIASGALSHNAYARFFDGNSETVSLNATFQGAAPPVTEWSGNEHEVVLTGKTLLGSTQLVVPIEEVSGSMIILKPDPKCVLEDGTTHPGWCAFPRRGDPWIMNPQALVGGGFDADASFMYFWGSGGLTKLPKGPDADKGMATFQALIDHAENEEDGIRVTINLDGFTTHVQEEDDEEERGRKLRDLLKRFRDRDD